MYLWYQATNVQSNAFFSYLFKAGFCVLGKKPCLWFEFERAVHKQTETWEGPYKAQYGGMVKAPPFPNMFISVTKCHGRSFSCSCLSGVQIHLEGTVLSCRLFVEHLLWKVLLV